MTSTTFAPNSNITREQLAAILYRYAAYKRYNTTASSSLSTFTDYASVSSYAETALKWAVYQKIMEGSNGKLEPTGTATRAQAAALFCRFLTNVK